MYNELTDSPVARVGSSVGGRSLIRGDGFGATMVSLFCNSAVPLPLSRRGDAPSLGDPLDAGEIAWEAGVGAFLTAAANLECAGS